ncbi:MAG: DUF6783 domain-containing protein [Anaerobutyricum hallii]
MFEKIRKQLHASFYCIYFAFVWVELSVNCDVHLAESIFQTRFSLERLNNEYL